MFLRATTRKKDGKVHRYFSVVENRRVAGGRVVQRHVLYLGEINSSQERAWRRSIEVIEDGAQAARRRIDAPWHACRIRIRGVVTFSGGPYRPPRVSQTRPTYGPVPRSSGAPRFQRTALARPTTFIRERPSCRRREPEICQRAAWAQRPGAAAASLRPRPQGRGRSDNGDCHSGGAVSSRCRAGATRHCSPG